jgi:DNA-binding NarL/FixJ family response regulator
MWSSYDNPTYVARAVALGATDYVLKSDGKAKIHATLEKVVKENAPVELGLLSRIKQTMTQKVNLKTLPGELTLTQREAQVLRHIGLGLSNKEIARSLVISVETVKEHVQNILRKMGANDRTDAAVRAIRLGVVE